MQIHKRVDITVIIPTLERHQIVNRTVDMLLAQKGGNFEIIVIDQSDRRNSDTIQGTFHFHNNDKVRWFAQKETNASAARNKGLLAARGEIILFLDDDMEIDSELFLKEHLSNYNNSDIAGVAGQILGRRRTIRSNRHQWSHFRRSGWLYFPLNYSNRCFQSGVGGGGNLSIRKSVALEVGGMDQNYERGAFREESDFIQRVEKKGYRFVFDPRASAVHIGAPSGGSRTWADTKKGREMQHIVGEWYFILRHGGRSGICHNLINLIRNQVLGSERYNLYRIIPSICVSLVGFYRAVILICNGPRTLLRWDIRNVHTMELQQNKNSYGS